MVAEFRRRLRRGPSSPEARPERKGGGTPALANSARSSAHGEFVACAGKPGALGREGGPGLGRDSDRAATPTTAPPLQGCGPGSGPAGPRRIGSVPCAFVQAAAGPVPDPSFFSRRDATWRGWASAPGPACRPAVAGSATLGGASVPTSDAECLSLPEVSGPSWSDALAIPPRPAAPGRESGWKRAGC